MFVVRAGMKRGIKLACFFSASGQPVWVLAERNGRFADAGTGESAARDSNHQPHLQPEFSQQEQEELHLLPAGLTAQPGRGQIIF